MTESVEKPKAERAPVDRLVMPFFDDRIKYGDLIQVYHYQDSRTRRDLLSGEG